jgi:hypothetical protein
MDAFFLDGALVYFAAFKLVKTRIKENAARKAA